MPDPPRDSLAWRLQFARKAAGLSQGGLVLAIHDLGLKLSKATIGRYEQGAGTEPTGRTLEALAIGTGVSVDWLLHGTGPAPDGGEESAAWREFVDSKRGRSMTEEEREFLLPVSRMTLRGRAVSATMLRGMLTLVREELQDDELEGAVRTTAEVRTRVEAYRKSDR